MTWVIVILLSILVVYLLYLLIHNLVSRSKLKHAFSKNNVIVFGKKGKGKDLLFQLVINLRKKPYYSNISYGGQFLGCCVKDLELGSNSYENFIKGNVEVIDKKLVPYEDKDFYLSDCGVILPSQHDNLLHKTYKGFPISYALSRHLWHNNIHCNTQNLERVWKALREQADTYIRVLGTEQSFFLPYLKVRFVIYDKYESAKQCLSMVPNRVWNSYSKAEKDIFNATNGLIEERFVYIKKKSIKYDTRAYHKIVFGQKFEKQKKKIRKKRM